VVILQDFNPGNDGEIIVRRGEEAHVLYTEKDWVYIIKRNGREGFVPISYCSGNSLSSSRSSKSSTTFERTIVHPDHVTHDQDCLKSNQNKFINHHDPVNSNQDPLICHRDRLIRNQDHFINHQDPSSSQQDSFISDTFDSDSFFTDELSDLNSPPAQTVLNSNRNERVLQPIYDNQNVRQTIHDNQRQSEHSNQSASQPIHGNQDVRPFRKTLHGQFIVLFEFCALDENDIPVERAELVNVLNIEDPEWSWVKKHDGQEGFVPKSYICPVEPLKAQGKDSGSNVFKFCCSDYY